MIKTRTWIVIFALILAVCTAAAVFLYIYRPEGSVVQILQDGKCLYEINLAAVSEPYTLDIEDGAGGSNRILVEPGRICVLEADCPDQICVRRGWLTDSASPIVCIPHRLVIRMTGPSQIDGMAD